VVKSIVYRPDGNVNTPVARLPPGNVNLHITVYPVYPVYPIYRVYHIVGIRVARVDEVSILNNYFTI